MTLVPLCALGAVLCLAAVLWGLAARSWSHHQRLEALEDRIARISAAAREILDAEPRDLPATDDRPQLEGPWPARVWR